jgi:hypothetical protein
MTTRLLSETQNTASSLTYEMLKTYHPEMKQLITCRQHAIHEYTGGTPPLPNGNIFAAWHGPRTADEEAANTSQQH